MSNQAPLELRQLTVMFCDIVDSTRLSQELDAETWRAFLENYFQICTRIFGKYGGYVHEYRGDGPLVYFGYPTPFEDSAYRAVAAGLEIKQYFIRLASTRPGLLGRLNINPPMVRISVHTGTVITGELRGKLTATGSMIALAERLQREAPANNLIISRETLNLVKTRFHVTRLGNRYLKGFDNACECFLVENEAELAAALTPFIGREAELEALYREWKDLAPGQPLCYLIKGEAGVGKSRLVNEFATSLSRHESQVIKLECSPYHSSSAFYPVIQALKAIDSDSALGGESDSSLLDTHDDENTIADVSAKTRAVLSELVALPRAETAEKAGSDPNTTRKSILKDLVEWLALRSKRSPLLLIVEDVRWIDPSTLELLERIAENDDAGPILLLMTYRENGLGDWECPFPTKVTTLGSISDDKTAEMIEYLAGDTAFPEDIIKKIAARADGIPLFIEELTRTTLERLRAANEDGASGTDSLSIPGSIIDLLTVRLDSLGSAREIAQIAAVIGRAFSLGFIQRIVAASFDEISAHLQTMEIAGFVQKIRDSNQNLYQFKHSLISDAAYASLISSRRAEIHATVAGCLEADYLAAKESESSQLPAHSSAREAVEPEIIAHHCARANLTAKAIQYGLIAGQRSKRRSAQAEAISHFRQVLELLQAPVEAADLDVPYTRMTTLLSLAACCDQVYGYSSNQAYEAYHEAEQIAIEIGDSNALLMAKFGLLGYFMMRGDFNLAFHLGEDCWEMAEQWRPSPRSGAREKFTHQMVQAQAALSLGCVLFHRAEFKDAMRYMDRCIELCRGTTASQRRLRHDPVVMCQVYQAWYTWETGLPDKALTTARAAVSTARESGLAFGTGVALAFLACIHLFRREYEPAIEIASESISISEEPGYMTWLAWAKVLRGRAMCEFPEQRQAGLDEVIEGLKLWDESGAIVTRPFALAELAECYQLNDQNDEALEQILIAQEMVEQYGERYYLAKIGTIYGNLLQADPDVDNDQQAEAAFRAAIGFAKARNMKASVLEASICLVRVLTRQNRLQQSVEILRSELFPEGPEKLSAKQEQEWRQTRPFNEGQHELTSLEKLLARDQTFR